MLAARPPSKNLGERCRWGAVHQAARKEKKVIHQATLQKPTSTFSMQIHMGLSLAFPTEWKGTESIVCNCCYTPLFLHLYSLTHLFKKELSIFWFQSSVHDSLLAVSSPGTYLCASIQLHAFPRANETSVIPKLWYKWLCIGRLK